MSMNNENERTCSIVARIVCDVLDVMLSLCDEYLRTQMLGCLERRVYSM